MTAAPTVAILTPIREDVTPEYLYALRHHSPKAVVCQVKGLPVEFARNALVRYVTRLRPRPTFCVWLDSDAFWMPGTIERLITDLEANPHLSLVSAWHGPRTPDAGPNGFRLIDASRDDMMERLPRPEAPLGSRPVIERCAFVGGHVMVHRTSLLDALPDDPFTVPEDGRIGEDFEFCKRIREARGEESVGMDVTVPVVHLDRAKVDGVEQTVGFVPGLPPLSIIDGKPQAITGEVKRIVNPRSYGERVTRALLAAGPSPDEELLAAAPFAKP